MKADTPGMGLYIILAVSASLVIQLVFELLCMKFVYADEEYQDILERERNIKEKIKAEKHKLLYG